MGVVGLEQYNMHVLFILKNGVLGVCDLMGGRGRRGEDLSASFRGQHPR